MKALIIFAHPNPVSFNAAILNTIKTTLTASGYEINVRDLYAMNFNPVFSGAEIGSVFSGRGSFEDAKVEQEFIAQADLVVFIYPIWWFSYPAILKGYIDRVLSHGFAFQYTLQGPKPLLTGKKAFVVQTGGNTPEAYRHCQLEGIPGGIIDKGTLSFTGFQTKVKTLLQVKKITDQERQQMLNDVTEELAEFVEVGELADHD